MKDRIETLILYSLIKNETYTRKVLPFLKEEYFSEKIERLLFNTISEFVSKYNALPTTEALLISINSSTQIKEHEYKDIGDYIQKEFNNDVVFPEEKWLLDKTEEWCKYQALRNAILNSINIIDDPASKIQTGSIPKLLTDALSVGFSTDIGHDYVNDSEKRYGFYHMIEQKLEFDLDLFNKITGGGVKKKSLFVIVAGTGAGKSLSLSHFAASFLNQNKNVLYITLEMAEEQIAKRIDANLLNVSMIDLDKIPKQDYDKRIERMKHKATGRLIIKEYPTASAHTGHFRVLLQELHLKKNFKPDVVIVDYLNIAASSRIKPGSLVNSYTYIKSIAEELRGLAMEFDVPCLTATQTNRQGQANTDLDFTDVSESHGLSATCDYMVGMVSTEELDKMNQVLFKQIKNRYGDISKYRRFVVGIDRDKMRLYDVEQSAQKDIADSGQEPGEDPIGFDKTAFGNRMNQNKDFSKIKFDDDSDDMF
jgi:replicative DNA helicase